MSLKITRLTKLVNNLIDARTAEILAARLPVKRIECKDTSELVEKILKGEIIAIPKEHQNPIYNPISDLIYSEDESNYHINYALRQKYEKVKKVGKTILESQIDKIIFNKEFDLENMLLEIEQQLKSV